MFNFDLHFCNGHIRDSFMNTVGDYYNAVTVFFLMCKVLWESFYRIPNVFKQWGYSVNIIVVFSVYQAPKCFTYINSLPPHTKKIRKALLLLAPLKRWRNWAYRIRNSCHKLGNRVRIQSQIHVVLLWWYATLSL